MNFIICTAVEGYSHLILGGHLRDSLNFSPGTVKLNTIHQEHPCFIGLLVAALEGWLVKTKHAVKCFLRFFGGDRWDFSSLGCSTNVLFVVMVSTRHHDRQCSVHEDFTFDHVLKHFYLLILSRTVCLHASQGLRKIQNLRTSFYANILVMLHGFLEVGCIKLSIFIETVQL